MASRDASERYDAVLAANGKGYRQHRIPAFTVTPTGALLAVYDGRPDLDDLPSPIDLVQRTSSDGGMTWTAPRLLRAADGLDGVGDASLLTDSETGRLWCFHASGAGVGFFESADGERDDDPAIQHVDLSFSV